MVIPTHLMSNAYFMVCFPEVGLASESVIDSISWRAKAAASRKKLHFNMYRKERMGRRGVFFFYYIEMQTVMPSTLKNAHLNETKFTL